VYIGLTAVDVDFCRFDKDDETSAQAQAVGVAAPALAALPILHAICILGLRSSAEAFVGSCYARVPRCGQSCACRGVQR
jgi:hypothetical protein